MIVITGASGKTGSKTAELLLKKGERVRVLGRSRDHLASLEKAGAEVRIGDQGDEDFLTATFSGADAVYLLIPPKMDIPDSRAYYNKLGDVAVSALKKAGVKKLVFLSSLGAEQSEGTGPVLGLHDVEKKLSDVKGLDLVFLRPGYFMENTLMNIGLIKAQKINGNSTAPDAKVLMAATADIAEKAAELLHGRTFRGKSVVDLFGHALSYKEATTIIGTAVGIPGLPYIQFSAADTVAALTGMGLSKGVAESFVELSKGIEAGKVTTTQGDPAKPNAPTTFNAFAEKVFAPAFKAGS